MQIFIFPEDRIPHPQRLLQFSEEILSFAGPIDEENIQNDKTFIGDSTVGALLHLLFSFSFDYSPG